MQYFSNETPSKFERLLVKFLKFRQIVQDTKLYLRRFYLTPTWRWLPFRIFLHHILLSDTDLAMHDHPASFITLPLKNSYLEFYKRNNEIQLRVLKAGSLAFNKAEHTHRLQLIKDVWTLVIWFKPRRIWGFHDPVRGFVPWRKYLNKEDKTLYPDYPEDYPYSD
jgi:hypothetical protein